MPWSLDRPSLDFPDVTQCHRCTARETLKIKVAFGQAAVRLYNALAATDREHGELALMLAVPDFVVVGQPAYTARCWARESAAVFGSAGN